MPPQTQVIAAVIERSGKILLGKRSLWKPAAPGYWCPVSGKIEEGETEIESAIREVFEEVGVQVEPIRKICEMDTRDQTARMHWWLMKLVEGEPTLKNDEHSEIRWTSLAEIEKLDPVFREDLEIYRSLQELAVRSAD